MEKISVIVPVYKVEALLSACVESIIGQTYENLEIILVDDGSPDSCPRLCDEWAERDGRIKVIHQRNRGLSGARNSALDIATGDYVTFVDSDDTVHPEMCKTLYDAMKRDGSDIAVGGYRIFSDSDLLEHKSFTDGEKASTAVQSEELFVGGEGYDRPEAWGKLYKREVFSTLRFKEGIYYEDVHLIPYVLKNSVTVSFCSAQVYDYRQNPTHATIMNSGFSSKKLVIFDIYLEHIRELYKGSAPTPAYGIAVNQLLARMTKARVLKKQMGIGAIFYKYYFRLFSSVVLAPRAILGLKQKLVYVSLIVPFGIFNSYYRKKITAARYHILNNL